jgi:hypothetical protein
MFIIPVSRTGLVPDAASALILISKSLLARFLVVSKNAGT